MERRNVQPAKLASLAQLQMFPTVVRAQTVGSAMLIVSTPDAHIAEGERMTAKIGGNTVLTEQLPHAHYALLGIPRALVALTATLAKLWVARGARNVHREKYVSQ